MNETQHKALMLLGLARKARKLEIGEEPCGIACRSGKAKLLLIAHDAGDHTFRRARSYCRAGKPPYLCVPGSTVTETTSAGLSAAATNFAGSSDQTMMSIFSPWSSSTTAPTLAPLVPTHAPTGSMFSSVAQTAIFVREPASRAMDLTSTRPDAISGTSSSKSLLTRPGCVLETMTCGPLVDRRTSTT